MNGAPIPCACPCRRLFVKNRKRRQYFSRECWLRDPARDGSRRLAGSKGGRASRASNDKARLARGERYKTKGHAYAEGYRHGYSVAMRWWQRKVARDRQRSGAAA